MVRCHNCDKRDSRQNVKIGQEFWKNLQEKKYCILTGTDLVCCSQMISCSAEVLPPRDQCRPRILTFLHTQGQFLDNLIFLHKNDFPSFAFFLNFFLLLYLRSFRFSLLKMISQVCLSVSFSS